MRFSFLIKAVVAAALIVAFDRLLPGALAGAVVGAFGAAWLIGLVIARADVRHDHRACIALAAAALFVTSLIDDPGPLGWTMFWCALSLAALLPRTARFDDAWRWAARLTLHAMSSAVQPIRDLRLGLRRPRAQWRGVRAVLAILALPLIGGGLFLALFAAANPVIANTLAAIRLPSLWQLLVWLIVGCGVWPSLRPHPAALRVAARLPDPEPVLPGTSLPSVLIALLTLRAPTARARSVRRRTAPFPHDKGAPERRPAPRLPMPRTGQSLSEPASPRASPDPLIDPASPPEAPPSAAPRASPTVLPARSRAVPATCVARPCAASEACPARSRAVPARPVARSRTAPTVPAT